MATEITFSIPDQYIAVALEAFVALSDKKITMEVHEGTESGTWNFSFLSKQGGETDKQFATRALKQTIRAIIRLHNYIEDLERYGAELATIDLPIQNIPDEIIE